MPDLTLLVPGLLGPQLDGPQGLRFPRLPALEVLLARGRGRDIPASDLETSLCSLFGLGPDAQADLPVAAPEAVNIG